jgi:hypothetical protein
VEDDDILLPFADRSATAMSPSWLSLPNQPGTSSGALQPFVTTPDVSTLRPTRR